MNLRTSFRSRLFTVALLPLLALFFYGCATDNQPKPENIYTQVSHLHVGDSVTVTLDGPPTPIPPHDEDIKEDGTITLDLIGPIQAAGKTLGQLQADIYNAYVPRYYTHLAVTVTTSKERAYYVQGEVNHPGEELYRDGMTVTRAIGAAGDFTDFANRKKVTLTRTNGERVHVNCIKVLQGEEADPIVYPGDQIVVPRRLW